MVTWFKESLKRISFQTSTLSVVKVLLEQGDPFPSNFDKCRQMRFLMCGILLGGLVISNAFKSENMHKIVLPRQHISYYNFDDLSEDNISVYNRIQYFQSIKFSYEMDLTAHIAELNFYAEAEPSSELTKAQEYSQIHPMAYSALIEPAQYISDFI